MDFTLAYLQNRIIIELYLMLISNYIYDIELPGTNATVLVNRNNSI